MSHKCARPGCPEVVPDSKLMCRDDWRLVPKAIQGAVNTAYAGGAGTGSLALLNAQQAAIDAADRESAGGR